ncbi:hypothetical protein LCGC14_2826930 [marine sediment metagenome]|uniref:Uncharacterized protein n=1 Tax=marine sediment metagenome TaxID=412755 RepID=A0A0F8YF73_9ZZZZ
MSKPQYNEYGLMPEEINLYEGFCKDHKTCNPEARGEMMEEEAAPAYTDIVLHMSTIGMYPSAKCSVCGTTKSICCQERINMT